MNNLNRHESKKLCNDILDCKFTDHEISELLIELATKGETSDEIAGFVDALLDYAEPFPNRVNAMDICGTGGGEFDRFNVSTVAAFILGTLGVKICKHGNRGSRKPNGSFDFIEELGIPIDLNGDCLSILLEKTNIAFIYARKFHPVMKNVVNARKLAGCRTIFNLAGPLSNPANIENQIIGTVNKKYFETLLSTARILNRKKCIAVAGEPGIDELSISGESIYLTSWDNIEHKIVPEDINLERINYSKIPSGNSKDNAIEFLKLIEGEGNIDLENMVCANVGLALHCQNECSIQDGIKRAKEVINSKLVKKKYIEYKELSCLLNQNN
jgi:anthranilate phosphoribosyltransferase